MGESTSAIRERLYAKVEVRVDHQALATGMSATHVV
jgi:hypothetical protein